ncbi:MAG: enoyl-CoA hydratase/isomerase family protein [Pseudomonadota bacterium]|nr:enoyl-CoA hydratase/isomerase family protein [Pseudomonadota bacterium]
MQQLSMERQGAVAVVRFNNPPKGYMNATTLADLEEMTLALDADDAVRAVVWTGAMPGIFIRHYDTDELAAMGRALQAKGKSFSADRPLPERNLDIIFNRLAASPKPQIAAINGTCMGGGLEFALSCDMRFAAAGDYRMGQIEIDLAILPGAGGVVRTARMIGAARAMELCLTGEAFGPAEAARLGLVNEVVPGDVLAHALSVATRIAAKSPRAVAHIKRIARAANEPGDDAALTLERTLFLDLLVQPDAVQALDAYNAGTLQLTDRKVPA